MQKDMLLPPNQVPQPKAWKSWKGVVVAVFALALAFNRWLPELLLAACYIAGTFVILNLLFHLLGRLRNKVFWRVRHRILGSFIFVGFIPLLVLFGVAYLSIYLLLGQLSAHYLHASLDELNQEVARINMDLGHRVVPPVAGSAFRKAAEKEFGTNAAAFPKLAALLLRKQREGSWEKIASCDPQGILDESAVPSADKWLQGKTDYEGLILLKETGLLASLRPAPTIPDSWLAVFAPLDKHVEERLLREKDIYLALSGIGQTEVRQEKDGVTVRMRNEGSSSEADVEAEIGALKEQLKTDTRRMIIWAAVLECRDYGTGETKPLALGIIRVPLKTLYLGYLSGAGNYGAGQYILKGILVLMAVFVLAELLSLLIGITISRRITRSVHDMYLGTMALKDGDLKYQIPVRRNDQLGLLAHSFNQMSSSITRLMEEVSEKKRLEQELEIAREVQAALFPKQLPHPRGLSLFGGCEPASVVSGDYYDFIHEDDARLHIVVGDISGKGISAALLMANLQAAMRNQLSTFHQAAPAETERRLSAVLEQLNTQIFLNSPREKYATLFAGRYDAESRRLCYCNAGHLPPVLLLRSEVKRLEAGGTVLGLFESAAYNASSIELEAGTVLAIFSDGITEAVNDADEEFGEERLVEALRESLSRPPEAIYRHVIAQVRLWQGNLKQHDDITLIVGKVE